MGKSAGVIHREEQAGIVGESGTDSVGVLGLIIGLPEGVLGPFGGLPEGVLGPFGGVPEGVLGPRGGITAGVQGDVGGVPEGVLGPIRGLRSGVQGDIGGVTSGVQGVIGDGPYGVQCDFVSVPDAVLGVIGGVPVGVIGPRIHCGEPGGWGDSWLISWFEIEGNFEDEEINLFSLGEYSSGVISVDSDLYRSPSPWKSFLLTLRFTGDGLRSLFFDSLFLKLVKK